MLYGNGKKETPWLITSESDFMEIFDTPNHTNMGYIKLLADLDFTGVNSAGNRQFNRFRYITEFDGMGHSITNLSWDISGGSTGYFNSVTTGSLIKRVHFRGFPWTGPGGSVGWYGALEGEYHFEDCIFSDGFRIHRFTYRAKSFTRCLETYRCFYSSDINHGRVYDGLYVINDNSRFYDSANNTGFCSTIYVLPEDRREIDSYPTLRDSDIWSFDGTATEERHMWSLIPQPYDGLPVTQLTGVTTVDGVPKQRSILVTCGANQMIIKKTISDEIDGSYLIDITPLLSDITMMIYDEMGSVLVDDLVVSVGDMIHPAVPNGKRYRCTTAGNVGTDVPDTIDASLTEVTINTAVFEALPVHKPVIKHGIYATSIIG